MDPQHIIDVCDANWEANKSDCNHFVKAVADALGVNLFNAGDDADTIINTLSTASGWSAIPDRATVEQQAAAGEFIIAGLTSKEFHPPRLHGHVVVVVSGDDSAHPGFPMAYWGTLNGVGQEDSSIRNAFIPGPDLDSVHYFGTSLSSARDFATTAGFRDISLAVENLISRVTQTIGSTHAVAGDRPLFFPNGIELIDLDVKAGVVEIKLTVAGPKTEPKP